MSNSFHAELIPPLVRTLHNLSHLLKRAESHATNAGFPVAVLLSSRLYPDMFDLTRQVQISTDEDNMSEVRTVRGDQHLDTVLNDSSPGPLHQVR